MKKSFILIFAGMLIGTVGCTYNDVYYNSQSSINTRRSVDTYNCESREHPYPNSSFSITGNYSNNQPPRSLFPFLDTDKAAPLPPPKKNPHICQLCGREFIPPYHKNHKCPYRNKDRTRWW